MCTYAVSSAGGRLFEWWACNDKKNRHLFTQEPSASLLLRLLLLMCLRLLCCVLLCTLNSNG